MTPHQIAIVPIESWSFASPELMTRGTRIDIGLLAESLLYYDRVLVNVANQPQFAGLLDWFIGQGCENELIRLIEDGMLGVYDYSFSFANCRVGDQVQFMHIQDPDQLQPDSFEHRFLDHPSVRRVLPAGKYSRRLRKALRGKVIEAKADDFGEAIDETRKDAQLALRNSHVQQKFVDSLYELAKAGRPPTVKTVIRTNIDGSTTVEWEIPINEAAKSLRDSLNFEPEHAFSAMAACNRLLLSASRQKCDIYAPAPLGAIIGDKLFESSLRTSKPHEVIENLQKEVEFPNIQKLVNGGRLNLGDILRFRRKAQRFRQWLQTVGERDCNAILAYHNEVGKDIYGLSAGRKYLRLFGCLGGAAVGAMQSDPLIAMLGAGLGYSADYLANLGHEWKPVVFGAWMKDRIERLLRSQRDG